ncbi:MAG: hypothetical protein KF886_14395 [Candidatus Hydrogenedentes bacterium]|nr:hypothetical protein [Candidatus Hydrogenedentota bacterium]
MHQRLTVAGLSYAAAPGAPHTVAEALIATAAGIAGDHHAGPGLRQVSMMHESAARAGAPDVEEHALPGMGRENILLRGDGLAAVRLLDTLEMGDAIIEVTRIGKRVSEAGQPLCEPGSHCPLSDFGVFGRVALGGEIRRGEPVRHQQRILRAHVITVSDRASAGEYADTSGPAVRALLEQWCADHHWGLWGESQVIPDEREAIATVLSNARQSGADVVITTGGTGVGPRDITPDVVTEFADKLIPGIMDFIRLKYGESMPMALASRSVAAVLGQGLIYTLPGSTRAIPEYLGEIFKTMEHMLLLLKGLDAHG